MQRVSVNGPHDPSIWAKMTRRADVISHSFTAKQAALMLTAMVRARHRDEQFLKRFATKFVPSLVPTAELIDLCGIVSGLSQLGTYREETFNLIAKRAMDTAPIMNARQLSLVANAFVRAGHMDDDLFQRLMKFVPKRLEQGQFTAREAAVILNAAAVLQDKKIEPPTQQLEEQLSAIAMRVPELLPKADLHSLTLMLNAFAKLRFCPKDALDLICEELASDERRFRKLSARQLAMVVNAAAKLQLYEPKLLEMIAAQVRIKARELDGHGLCVVANAAAKLRLGLETFDVVYAQVPRLMARLTGRQLAMLCHAWAKAHIHNDDLFALLAVPLAKAAGKLTAHEVAITAYGYAHFRKAPPELFESLLQRVGGLLEADKMTEKDLLMLGNALGRLGICDPLVQESLRAYARREPALTNLSPPCISTFSLQ